MASIKKISSATDWGTTDSNRVSFSSNGVGKLFYFDHGFSGLSVDSLYWQIMSATGSPYEINDGMYVEIDNSNSIDYLRSRHYYSGNFDICTSYENLSYGTTSTTRYLYFGLTDKSIDSLDNITIRIGVGVESSAVSIVTEVLEDNETSSLYSSSFARNYTSGKLRLKKTGTIIEFYAEDLAGSWEKLGDFTNAAIGSHDDLHLFYSSRFDAAASTDFMSVAVTDIVDQTNPSEYYGNSIFDFNFDETGEYIYYSVVADSNQVENTVAVRVKSAETEAGLDLASWSSYSTDKSGEFVIGSADKYFSADVKLLTTRFPDSPVIDSIRLGLEALLESDDAPDIVAPSPDETFDNLLRILWKVPTSPASGSATRYYKIEYKNSDLGISNWTLITNRANPDTGFYDWNTSGLEEDDGYQIRITTIFVESGGQESLPDSLLVSDAGSAVNGVYYAVGVHNGESLYESDSYFIYFNGSDSWYINSEIDNESGLYYSGIVLGGWSVGTGDSPAPIVSEYQEVSSDESDLEADVSSSSYDFSSTSSHSSSSSSTQARSTSTSSQSSESSSSESTRARTSSSSTPSSSESSQSTESTQSTSSTERQNLSTVSSPSSESTAARTSSSESTQSVIFRGTGNNLFGQLGVGDFENRDLFTKVQISEYQDLRLMASGAHHAFIQNKSGKVLAAGRNSYGQLGFGDTVDRSTFTELPSDYDYAKEIVCGEHFTLIKKNDGTVWVCGRNNKGQLGLGDEVDRLSFEQLPIKYTNYKKAAAGAEFLMIEKLDGYLDVVGANDRGQLGLGDEVDRNEFEETFIRYPRKIAGGSLFSYYEADDGKLYSTGDNFHGQLGLGDTDNRSSYTLVSGIANLGSLVAGGSHILAVDQFGNLRGCGDNTLGQLGLGDNYDRTIFVSLGVGNPILVRSGFHHSVVVMANGKLNATGYNFYGQLGLGYHSNSVNIFTEVRGYDYPESVSCGGYHTFVLTEFAESESSTERFETSSSSWSVDDEFLIYPYGYFQSSESNMASVDGVFYGDAFYMPGNDAGAAMMTHVATSIPGDWWLEKADEGSSESFSFYCNLKVGAEVYFYPQLRAGDLVRVVFDGPAGVEVYAYKIYFRIISEWSSSSSTYIAKSTSSYSSESSSSSSSSSSESTPSNSTSSTSTLAKSTSTSSESSPSSSSKSSSTARFSTSSESSSTINQSTSSNSSSSSSSTQIMSSSESSSSSTLLKSSTSTQYLPSSESSQSSSSSSSESSSSTPSSSSSTSVDEPVAAFANGYFEISAVNLADANGDYTGNTVAISENADIVMISYVAATHTGSWAVQRFNGVAYVTIATPAPGKETTLSTGLTAGDEYRILYNGPSGAELLSYRVDFRLS